MSTRVVVLGLLTKSPMHGYEIQKILQQSKSALWSNVLPGSIYHSLKKMSAEGLIMIHASEQTGNRSRYIYEITEKGRNEFVNLVKGLWENTSNQFPVELYTAIAFIDVIPSAEIEIFIERQIAILSKRLLEWNEGINSKGDNVNPYQALAFANGVEHIKSDLNLYKALKEQLARAKTNTTK